jgi:tetratricopeptide (TPR) repeat protein
VTDTVKRIRSSIRGVMLVGILSVSCLPGAAQVRVWEGTLTLSTYEEGKPDPNPPFDTYATVRFNYPYTLRTNLTGVKGDHNWRAVFLENEYLKCTVLPDIGGHLYTCVDKISGQPMFYANPSIKKAQIGYRGAWAAFGVEYNFPVSHNWVSMSPVDFAYAANPDGSASISVGNIDRAYGMQWGVELVLNPSSTLLEERVTLYNRSDVRHRYYWWNNAGVQVWDDSRIDYPMQFVASHGYTEVYRWPVDPDNVSGKDLSVISNQTDGAVSFFVHGSREPFMGIWNPHTQTGVVHYAEYRDLPAKKIWSWGVDPSGLDWRTALSDNHSAYVEVQAGLFRNQETYAFLEPGQTIRFSEYWMPVRGTGGVSRANKAGVVRFETHDSAVSVAMNVNQPVSGAKLSLTQGGRILWSGTVDLTPESTWLHSVTPEDRKSKVTFELLDRDGKSLLKQTDGVYDWDPAAEIKTGRQESHSVPLVDARSEDDWLQLGTDEELNGKVVQALATYEAGMKRFPQSASLQVATGRLAAALQRFAEAAPLLRAAQLRNTSDSEIGYYLGVAEEGLGHTREAESAFDVAFRQASYRGRAAVKLGELQARGGNLEDASIFLRAAVADTPLDLRANEELEAVTRSIGNVARADELTRRGLAEDPMNDFLREEQGVPDLQHLAADPYRVLRAGAEYMTLGFYQKAIDVLGRSYPAVAADQSEPGSVLPQNHPLVLYYLAYCNAKLGRDSQGNWQVASRRAIDYVFPSSSMDRIVLEAAVAADGSDATAHYLLGTLLFSKGLHDEGMAHWEQAKQYAAHLPVLDASMGEAWLQVKRAPQRALAAFREGVKNDPDNSEVYLGLDQAMSLSGASAAERAAELSRYPSADTPQSKMAANLVYQLGLARAEAGQFEQAFGLFHDRFFPSEEGGVTSGQVLFEIRLMQAEAQAKAGNCNATNNLAEKFQTDSDANGSSSRDYFRMAEVMKLCGHPQESAGLLREAAARTGVADVAWAVRADNSLGEVRSTELDVTLRAALVTASHLTETSSAIGFWWYDVGILQMALRETTEAKGSFERALLLPDTNMSHHLAYLGLAEADGQLILQAKPQ